MSNQPSGMYSPGRGKKVLALVFGVVMFLAMAVFFVDLENNSQDLCYSCHAMRPEYYTWKASSHSQLGCVQCHRGEGLKGQVEFIGGLARMAESTVLQNYVTPIRLFRSIDDERCFKCHSFNRQTTASGDLIIPHQDHTSSNVRCASCHSAIAHGDIARRRITANVGYERWDQDQGLQEMARQLTQPSMDTCMSCHYRRRITTDCAACHTDMYGPENHTLADFGVNHGRFARDELEDCNFCHGYVGPSKLVVSEKTDLTEYSRQNTFCITCHRQLPETHKKDNFFGMHGQAILSGSREQTSCLTCHDNNTSDLPQATRTSCGSCHPSTHGKNWQRRHRPAVMPGEKIQEDCLTCHSTTTCLSCHHLPGYSDWWTTPDLPVNDFNPYEEGTDFFM